MQPILNRAPMKATTSLLIMLVKTTGRVGHRNLYTMGKGRSCLRVTVNIRNTMLPPYSFLTPLSLAPSLCTIDIACRWAASSAPSTKLSNIPSDQLQVSLDVAVAEHTWITTMRQTKKGISVFSVGGITRMIMIIPLTKIKLKGALPITWSTDQLGTSANI